MSMTAICRLTDLGDGVECADPRQSHRAYTTTFVTGASTVFINNLAVVRVTDVGDQTCGHSSTAVTGSATVFVENLAVHRIGDIGEGGAGDTYTAITGSANVYNDGA